MTARTTIALPLFDRFTALDAVGPYEVFAGATRLAAASGTVGYAVRLVSVGGGPVRDDENGDQKLGRGAEVSSSDTPSTPVASPCRYTNMLRRLSKGRTQP